ncbi:MAG: HPr family phosphocarrier protein [Actinomycetota bacterium]
MSTTTIGRDVEVRGAAGLHARPAADFATAAARFRSDIRVLKAGKEVDAKSVLLLLTLDVRQGDRVIVSADGPDAEVAVDTLAKMLEAA